MVVQGQKSSREWRKQWASQKEKMEKKATQHRFVQKFKEWEASKKAIIGERPTRESVRKAKMVALYESCGERFNMHEVVKK